MPKQHRRSLWEEFSSRGRMYLVLALCCLTVTISSGAGLLLIGQPQGGEPEDPAEQIVTESGYDRNASTIDTQQFSGTILPAGEDAGEQYVQETLFLGDSNTARMYRLFDFCSYDNAAGSVGMTARSLASYACVGFEGISGYQTMPKAVELMQPKRVIITFGTNDLNPNTSTETFIGYYATGIQAVQAAYPSVDVIVNAIPPLGRQHSGEYLTQQQIDEWNRAIVEMCEKNGWKFLNSAEVLKDEGTGYARSGYVESDGIHLTRTALEVFFNYVRTHSYVTEDDRPALGTIPRHTKDRDVVEVDTALPSSEPPAEEQPAVTATPEPSATPEASITPEPTGAPEDFPAEQPTAEPSEAPTETPAQTETPTPTEEPAPTETPTPENTPGGDG